MPVVDKLPYTPWTQRGHIVDGEFRWRLGVRPLDPASWIEFGPDADGPDGWLAEKSHVLAQHRDQAFVVRDDIEAESVEIAKTLVAHLAEHHSDRPHALDAALHPLEAASRLVPEDLVVMVERDGHLLFGGGVVCFPNRWDLPSKLGRTMAEVHQPVAALNDQLESGIDRFLERLEPERPSWRLGWGIIDTADGFTPTSAHGAGTASFVRVERETLRRFPGTRAVLFTIRTYVAPLESVAPDPRLAAALRSMPVGVRAYKDVDGRVDDLVSVLDG